MGAQQQQHLAQLFGDWYAATGHYPQAAAPQQEPHALASLLAAAAANATGGAGAGGAAAASAAVAALLEALQQGGLQLAGPAAGGSGGGGSMNGSQLAWAGAGGGDDPAGPVKISLVGLLLAACLIGVNGVISLWLRLGLHSKLGVAAVRSVKQGWPVGVHSWGARQGGHVGKRMVCRCGAQLDAQLACRAGC